MPVIRFRINEPEQLDIDITMYFKAIQSLKLFSPLK